MKKVPCMLSTKDSSYINDIFNWNITAYHKTQDYLKKCNDEAVCKELKKISKMHYTNCSELVNFLKGWDSNES